MTDETPTVLHIRQIGAYQHNLCGWVGGEATHASAATCVGCQAVLVAAEPKFAAVFNRRNEGPAR